MSAYFETVVHPARFDLPEAAFYIGEEFDRLVPVSELSGNDLAEMRHNVEVLRSSVDAACVAKLTELDIRDYELSGQPTLFDLPRAA